MVFSKDFFVTILTLFMILKCGSTHNIVKRDAKAEQDMIRNYQIQVQGFVETRETGEENIRSEPLQCYSCYNAKSNEECNSKGMVTCHPTQTTCQTEIRVYNPIDWVNVRIKKGCKQERACGNNYRQNDKKAWPSQQCNHIPRTSLSVCRYCCTEPGCNNALPDRVCGHIPSPDKGSVVCTKSNLKATLCTFECEPCHRLEGSKVRMCLEDAMWSGEETKCIYDETLPSCEVKTACSVDILVAPTNGFVECTNGNEFGSQCRFQCEKGYFVNGKRVLRCSGDKKQWDGERPLCVRGDDSSNPCHIYSVFEFATDGQLLCECRTGFEGDGFISCNDVNECAEELDVCDENAYCINTLGSYGCECKAGYSGNGFECGDINECASNGHTCDTENGICVNNDGSYSCTCKPEYTGDGKNCTKVNFICPGGLRNDVCLTGEPVPVHDVPDFPEEYLFEEPPTQSKVFSEETTLQSCVRMPEYKPAIVRDAYMYEVINENLLNKIVETSNNSETVIGPFVGLDDRLEKGVLRWRDGKQLDKNDFQIWAPGQPKMIDDQGFGNCVNLVSDPLGSRTASFLWQITLCSSPTRYICDTERSDDEPAITLCVPLVEIAHGRMKCSRGWRPSSVCSFSCDPGYILKGPSSRVTCREKNLMWDNELPVCVRAVCAQPLMPPNSGQMECSNENKEYSVCKFSCKSGYTLHGNETVTCQRNLKWSSQRPCCRDDCPPYARMNLILVLDSSRSISAENFQLIKRFAKNLHQRFEVSEDFTQVSVITYSSSVKLLDDKLAFTSSEELDLALDELPYEGAGTLIGNALNYVSRNLIGKRPGTGDVVVVLTDGISHDDVYFPSKRLREAGAHLVSVGVKHAWRYQLQMIASEPTDINVVEVEDYNDLGHIVNVIGEKVCHLSC